MLSWNSLEQTLISHVKEISVAVARIEEKLAVDGYPHR
jgi:hypothetical protein